MTQKIGIIILHGAGSPDENFADGFIQKLSEGFGKQLKNYNPKKELVFQSVFWSSVFEDKAKALWERMETGADLDYNFLRRFAVNFLADAVAYQPTPDSDHNYDNVHALLAQCLNRLQTKAGARAPLCVISHSLGSVVASNYFLDLQVKQRNIGINTKRHTSNTPLEKGETLSLFYTLGSPLALWSLRYTDFGVPVSVPSPSLHRYHTNVTGEWLNFYDKDDILAYPLKNLNKNYQNAVTEDVQVNVGGLLTKWNPLSHSKYDNDNAVIARIVEGLVRTWRAVNH
ncbi:hypothetical protein SAMN05216238_11115 [Lentibacillus persicus]|uniref:Chemotaxis protein n=1 Tax=Lentibacillus persicus TaxID=640948 RepID=A0A1I1YYA2_9BACI|nr:chemotaxis protein [Lentibacillus persicus]SFE24272.1 hypothetical protein SAMN05216238_11115 [Lentibacillus persicus]